QTFYRWKKQFAGRGVAELRRLRQLENEHRRLKQLVADLTLDKYLLQEGLRKQLYSRPRNATTGNCSRQALRSAGGVRAAAPRCIARATALAAAPGISVRCGNASGRSPPSACGMALGACIPSCDEQAGRSTSSGSTAGVGWTGSLYGS